ncbi:unnamed protein product [Cuscuta europaea]|uniref:Uncharacterized protein n=1 Tax=Cuscuta europaea TaxID=41803 RepID=A0A9P0Z0A5_CUSEU|nr:unnamed protein product [Cuscuta europaea]
MAAPNHQLNKISSALPVLPPTFPSHHPTRKRLPDGSSSNSTSFESTSLDQLSKRITRALPNFSDCHGCRTRVNHTKPKDRLQTLDSYWRIVLLCKKCIHLVNCAQICSYCFKETVNLDCFSCSRCGRCIHKNCVVRYDSSSPWSYSCKERETVLDFSVCVDCWIPKLLKNSNSSRSVEKALSKSRATRNSSKPSLNDYDANLLTCKNDLKSDANKKILFSAKEKGKALRSVMDMTQSLSELPANNEADDNINQGLIVRNSITCSSCSSTDAASASKYTYNAELAFELHCSTNGFAQVSKDSHLTNTNYLPVLNARDCNYVDSKPVELEKTPKYGEGREIVVYRRRLREKCDLSISEGSVCAMDKDNSSFDSGRHELRTYKRTRLKRKELQENERNDLFFRVDGMCNSDYDSRVVLEAQSIPPDYLTKESHLYQVSIPSPAQCDGVVTLQTDKEGHYMLKYSRRCMSSKPGLDDAVKCYEKVSSQSDKEDRYMITYFRRCIPAKPKLDNQVKCDGKVILQSDKEDRYMLKYSRRCLTSKPGLYDDEVKCDGKVTPQNESCNGKDYYKFKYSRRHRGNPLYHELPLSEVIVPCQVECDVKVTSQYESCNAGDDRYSLKYSKRCIDKANLRKDTNNMDSHYLIKYSKRHACSKEGLDHNISMCDALVLAEYDP